MHSSAEHRKAQACPCSVSNVLLFQFAANVHLLCAKLQIYVAQRAAHDQLYAANSNRDVRSGHTSYIHARFHLYSTNGHPPEECYDYEEKGAFSCVATNLKGRNSGMVSLMSCLV